MAVGLVGTTLIMRKKQTQEEIPKYPEREPGLRPIAINVPEFSSTRSSVTLRLLSTQLLSFDLIDFPEV
ncbi:hypothetical protein M8J76_010850 [Diaphorina citri]|nr:hypothetical protein M8J76_010850 [Diaphorina citri]